MIREYLNEKEAESATIELSINRSNILVIVYSRLIVAAACLIDLILIYY